METTTVKIDPKVEIAFVVSVSVSSAVVRWACERVFMVSSP